MNCEFYIKTHWVNLHKIICLQNFSFLNKNVWAVRWRGQETVCWRSSSRGNQGGLGGKVLSGTQQWVWAKGSKQKFHRISWLWAILAQNILQEYFGQFGELESVTVKMDSMTGRSRGFAFILYKTPEGVDAAAKEQGHEIKVEYYLSFSFNYFYQLKRSTGQKERNGEKSWCEAGQDLCWKVARFWYWRRWDPRTFRPVWNNCWGLIIN